MEEFFRPLFELRWTTRETLVHIVDILLVSYVIYRLLALIRGSRAWRIVGGIVIFVVLLVLSKVLGFQTLYWLLDKATILAPVAVVILLLPELRQALEGFGRLGFWPKKITGIEGRPGAMTIEELCTAFASLSHSRTGALIVVERSDSLSHLVSSGVQMDSIVSAPVVESIFFGANPLHDGAVLVRGDRIVAAACRLPLSESMFLDKSVHMRHRAAVGITEQHDCVAFVVSEERGTISLSSEGGLERIAHDKLREVLLKELRGEERAAGPSKLFRGRRVKAAQPESKDV